MIYDHLHVLQVLQILQRKDVYRHADLPKNISTAINQDRKAAQFFQGSESISKVRMFCDGQIVTCEDSDNKSTSASEKFYIIYGLGIEQNQGQPLVI